MKEKKLEKDPAFKNERIDVMKVCIIPQVKNPAASTIVNCLDYAIKDTDPKILFIKH